MVSVVALQGCQVLDAFDGDAPAQPEPSIEVTTLPVDPAYPELRTVPPRPQLSYSVEQHREIVEGLIGDREHARYTSQRIRYRTGLSSLPPPPPPEADDEATSTAKAIVGDGQQAPESPPAPRADVPAAAYDISDPALADDASLGDFMRNMIEETGPTSPATAEPSPSDDAPQPDAQDSSGVNPSPEMSAAPSSRSSAPRPSGDRSATRLFAWIDDVEEDAGPIQAVAAAAPSPEDASPEPPQASPPAGAVPVQAAALPQPDGARANTAGEVRVAAASEPAAARPGTNDHAQLSRHDAGQPSPPPPAAARPTKPERGSEVSPAPEAKPEPGAPNAPRSDGAFLATVTFAEGSAELPADATSRLQDALASLKGRDQIEIVGRGEVMTLALDRARAVAVDLMRLGAGAGALKIAAEAASAANEVRIRVGGQLSGN